MKLSLPQSLFKRLLLGLLATFGLAHLGIALLIIHERRELSFWTSEAWNAADNIAIASRELAHLDKEKRDDRIEEYRTQRRALDHSRPPPPARDRAEMERIRRAFAEKIRAQLGSGYEVTIAPARGRSRNVIPIWGNRRPDAQAAERGPPPNLHSPDSWFDVAVKVPDGDLLLFRTLAPRP